MTALIRDIVKLISDIFHWLIDRNKKPEKKSEPDKTSEGIDEEDVIRLPKMRSEDPTLFMRNRKKK